ncbi:hypothetical protein RIVM261_078970 [Rivularia sp. IAM M-261]|nr:hypothetical protein RIVM261_078970 [Rivularia sp. IAM M-261]
MASKLIPFQVGNKWGYKDKKDLEIIEAKYDFAHSFSEKIAAVKINDK